MYCFFNIILKHFITIIPPSPHLPLCIHFFPELIPRRCGVFLNLNDARQVVFFQHPGAAAALVGTAVGDFFDNAKALHQGDDFFYIYLYHIAARTYKPLFPRIICTNGKSCDCCSSNNSLNCFLSASLGEFDILGCECHSPK